MKGQSTKHCYLYCNSCSYSPQYPSNHGVQLNVRTSVLNHYHNTALPCLKQQYCTCVVTLYTGRCVTDINVTYIVYTYNKTLFCSNFYYLVMKIEHVCVFVFLCVCFQNSNYLTKERASFAVDDATLFISFSNVTPYRQVCCTATLST